MRILKRILFALLILVLALGITGFIGYTYFDNKFLSFEDGYEENTDLETIELNGYEFIDRNGNGELDVYEDDRQPIDQRVADVLAQMTIEEKIHLLKGSGIASAMGQSIPGGIPGAVGTIVPTPRLGIPTVFLSDGPAGLRIEPIREGEDRTYYCTAFPIATVLASTWNEELVFQVGNAMGTEAKEYGIDVILGPGANIHRHPLNGRNFEYYSEDPVVSGKIGAAMINGIESNGVGTSVKHFVANNQETDRAFNDVIVSERAMREIYLRGFEIMVKEAQPWTIMSSYNKVNGTYTSESEYLLTEVLRDEWGFEGLVMTDWFGGRNAPAQINAGNDLLEPGTKKQWDALIEAHEDGVLSEEKIDRAAGRILTLVFKTRKMQNYTYGNNPDLEAHAAITRQSAAEGMILLKNESALPLKDTKNVALLGVTSYGFIAGGTGSGDVNEAYTVSLEEGLRNSGFQINEAARKAYNAHEAANAAAFEKPEGMDAMFNPFTPPEIDYTADQMASIAASADVGILTIGRNAGEGGDRVIEGDFLLTKLEQDLIAKTTEAFHKADKKLIVVLNIGGVIETQSWKDTPDAILLAWQGGQEGGNSVADILSGAVNPSGKLTATFPVNLTDHASAANFPEGGESWSALTLFKALLFPPEPREGDDVIENRDYTQYDEDVYVGYRHFDSRNMAVSYPFGYGLSYTTFEYADLQAEVNNDSITVSFSVTNTGEAAGKEVVQLYTEKLNSVIDRPVHELKAFAKTTLLAPGASESVTLKIPISDLRYWDENQAKWVLEAGEYGLKVGASSRDIRLQQPIDAQ